MKFTKTHEWINAEETPHIIGITNHAQASLGDVVFVELPEVGQTVHAGDELGVIESVKAASDFYAPISGTIVAINTDVSEDPTLINRDPEGHGWLFKITPNNPEEQTTLLSTHDYHSIIAEEHN
jgi:glycine cleavage system H protein